MSKYIVSKGQSALRFLKIIQNSRESLSWKMVFITVFLLVMGRSFAGVEGTMPDLYSELVPEGTRDKVATNVVENIDPFSGGLTLSHEDLVVPGNGGLDIKIQRIYNSNNVYQSRNLNGAAGPNLVDLLERTPTGLGWTLHFGKVTRDISQIGCSPIINEELDNLNNPIFEAPDGSQQILHYNDSGQSGINAPWVTKNHWVAYCTSGGGFEVISPEGLRYIMGFQTDATQVYGGAVSMDHVWYTTRVIDPNGNYYNISYNSNSTGNNPVFDEINASDGRRIDFTYRDVSNDTRVRLDTIKLFGGPTWRYYYSTLSNYPGHYILDRVVRPDGLDWEYTYFNKTEGSAGDNLLDKITYPYGATTRYTYGYECMGYTDCTTFTDRAYSMVVTSKTNGGRDVSAGVWSYNYSPSNSLDKFYDCYISWWLICL